MAGLGGIRGSELRQSLGWRLRSVTDVLPHCNSGSAVCKLSAFKPPDIVRGVVLNIMNFTNHLNLKAQMNMNTTQYEHKALRHDKELFVHSFNLFFQSVDASKPESL